MAESIEATEAKLKKVGERIRASFAELHPAKQEHRDAVQRALAQQLQQESAQTREQLKAKQSETTGTEQEPKKSPRHRHGH